MIRVEGLSCHVGPRVLLDQLSFALEPGWRVAVVGANGAGKSTLLRVLAGEFFQRREFTLTGAVACGGRPLPSWDSADLAKRRGFLMQAHAEGLACSVRELVRLGAYPHGGLRRDQSALLDDVLARWQLAALAERSYGTLSGGERQRAQLARTDLQVSLHGMAAERLWLLDEPLNSLDLPHQQLLREQLRAQAAAGALVVFSVHDINFALRSADRVLALRDGRLCYAGEPRGLAVPEMLRDIFDTDFVCLEHPHDGLPLVLPA